MRKELINTKTQEIVQINSQKELDRFFDNRNPSDWKELTEINEPAPQSWLQYVDFKVDTPAFMYGGGSYTVQTKEFKKWDDICIFMKGQNKSIALYDFTYNGRVYTIRYAILDEPLAVIYSYRNTETDEIVSYTNRYMKANNNELPFKDPDKWERVFIGGDVEDMNKDLVTT